MSLIESSRVPLGGALGGAAPESKSLGFDIEAQQQTQWCWAAVAVSVARFYKSASSSTQCSVVSAELNQATCCTNGGTNKCNKPWFLENALQRVEHLDGARIDTHLQFGEVVTEIDEGQPLGVRIGWKGGGGHFVVVDGYATASQMVDVKDPWEDGHVFIPYATLRDRYNGNGSWTHSYRTKG